MSAEGQLYNAALFAPASPSPSSPLTFDTGLHLPCAKLALEPSIQADVATLSREKDLHEMLEKRDAKEVEGLSAAELMKVDPATGLKVLPHWLAQPYFWPQPIVS
ncbi:hypothetical protein PILCRDRAFT_14820 [Piloderma croceum F 1598]|uniref:Uncharacterized protein n=1 Tax=Piloderma croceum (strain F 1598) TaxID=765440 RepID=A0A0C3EMU3_PILCF|nr:hypothetical protein PILCRDRAFT_14820 [Piloderma croceum F 1598]